MPDVDFTDFSAITPEATDQLVFIDDPGGSPVEGKATVQAAVDATTATQASSAFGTDNRLIKSDGTGRLEQATGITVDDSDNVSGMGTLSCGAITTSGTVDGVDLAAHDSGTAEHGATGAVVGTTNTQTLTNKTLTLPVIASVSNSGTVTFPTGTRTLVARATTDTLTNKTLTLPIISSISNGGTLTLPTGVQGIVGTTASQTLTNKTLTTPTIASMTNAQHNHQNAAGGGALSAAAITSGTVATARLGTGTASSSTFLRGDQTWAAPATATVRVSKSFTRKDPTSSDDISLFFTNVALSLTEIRAVLIGSSTPSVTWTIRWNSDRSATGTEAVTGGTTTTSTTTGSDVTSFDATEISADSHVWFETTAQSGTVTELSLTLFFEEA